MVLHKRVGRIVILVLWLFVQSIPCSFSQEVFKKEWSYSCVNLSLDKVLHEISGLTKVNISFNQTQIEKHTISYTGIYKELKVILKGVLQSTPFGFYIINENQIVIYPVTEQRHFYKIHGRVTDSVTGEALIAVEIKDIISKQMTRSNDYGNFYLTSDHPYVKLEISYFGYVSKSITLDPSVDHSIDIHLHSALALPEFTVDANKQGNISRKFEDISVNYIKESTALLGENDLFKTLHSLQGVHSGSDGFGGLNVHGGSYDQNLILMDDIPIYYPSHAIGLFSIFNTTALKNVKFFSSEIPSKYGGRLSSVLDIHSKEGNTKNWDGDVSVGILNGKISLEGPIVKDKISVFTSYRRTLLDPFLKEITRYYKGRENRTGATNYWFYDLNSKISWKMSNKDQIYLSYYKGGDYFNDQETESYLNDGFLNQSKKYDHLDWGNELISLRYNRNWKNNIFTHLVVYQSKFHNSSEQYDAILQSQQQTRIDSLMLGRNFYSNIQETGGNLNIQFNPIKGHWFQSGIQVLNQKFLPSAFSYNEKSRIIDDVLNYVPAPIDSIQQRNQSTLNESSLYVEDLMHFSEFAQLRAGFRVTYIRQDTASWSYFQPRLSLSFFPSIRSEIKFTYGMHQQSSHLLTSSSIGLPTDLWVPSVNSIHPETSQQVTASVGYKVTQHHTLLAEGYSKLMDNLLYVREGANFALGANENWMEEVTVGRGKAYGLLFSSSLEYTKLTLYQSLSLSKAEREFPELNFGERFNYRFDRPFVYSINLIYKFKSNLILSGHFEYGKGSPLSLPIGEHRYLSTNNGGATVNVLEFREINNSRLPDNIRVDVGVLYKIIRKRFSQEIQFGIYNILNRKNPVYLELKDNPAEPRVKILNQISLLPLLPSLQYRIYFR